MAWIESHQSLGRHPKLLKLAGILRIHKAQAIGHLKYLWWWALDYVPKNGDTSAFTSAEISAGSEWPGNVDEFHAALKSSGWIDPDGKIHDWEEYSDPCYSSRERQRRYRKSRALRNGNVTDYVTVTPYQSNPTIPTIPKKKGKASPPAPQRSKKVFQKPTPEEVTAYGAEIGFHLDGKAFWNSYEAKGWMIGKNHMKDWKACVRTWRDNGYPCKMARSAPRPAPAIPAAPEEPRFPVKCPKCQVVWQRPKSDTSDLCASCQFGKGKFAMRTIPPPTDHQSAVLQAAEKVKELENV